MPVPWSDMENINSLLLPTKAFIWEVEAEFQIQRWFFGGM